MVCAFAVGRWPGYNVRSEDRSQSDSNEIFHVTGKSRACFIFLLVG